jgi:CHAD domain-containing protein
VARPRDVPGLDCEQKFALAAAEVVEVRAGEVFEHATGVLGLDDVEPLHDMRVATRRLRVALEVFAPCFPRKRHKRTLKQVKRLAAALGERRDRDVSIAFLAGFLEQAPAADRARLDVLLARIRAEQEDSNERLAPFVAEERLGRLRDSLARLVKAARR